MYRRHGSRSMSHWQAVCPLPPGHSAFRPRSDLTVEHPRKTAGDVRMSAAVHEHLFAVAHPVQVSPHFAAVYFFRPLILFEKTKRRNDLHDRRNVRIMLVRNVVRIDETGLCRAEDLDEFRDDALVGRIFDLFGRMPQKDLCTVFPDKRRFLLFGDADRLHVLVGKIGIQPVARAARSVRRHDGAEPLVRPSETLGYGRICHKLDVILMCRDRKMRRAGKSNFFLRSVRYINDSFFTQFHINLPLSIRSPTIIALKNRLSNRKTPLFFLALSKKIFTSADRSICASFEKKF